MSNESIMIRCSSCFMLNRVPETKLAGEPRCGNCKTILAIPREPVRANAENFDRDIAYWPETLLVAFMSQWCVYCKIYDPLVSELASQRAGRLKVMKVDVEMDKYLAERFSITKTPTFIVYKNGIQSVRLDGTPKDKGEFVTWIDNLINYTSY